MGIKDIKSKKKYKMESAVSYTDGVSPDPTFAYDFAKEWLNRPRKRSEEYDMYGAAMAAEMGISEWEDAKEYPMPTFGGAICRAQVALLSQLFLHPEDCPLGFSIDDFACRDGFLHLMKRPNKGTILDALTSPKVPYAFVEVQNHVCICSYDAGKKRLVFMNSLNIRELDKVHFLKVCAKQDEGPTEYCMMTLSEHSRTKRGSSTPADVELAEALFMGNEKCRTSKDTFWPNRLNWPSSVLTQFLPLNPKAALSMKIWEFAYLHSEKQERLMTETIPRKTAKRKAEREYSNREFTENPMSMEEMKELEKALFEEHMKKNKSKNSTRTKKSYSRMELGFMYLASKLAERGIEVRVIEGFQDSSDDYDSHVGCQTVVWLIAALIRSKTFTSNPALSVSLIDSYSPDNRDGKMITALSKFASFVYSRGFEFGKQCGPILETGDAESAAKDVADIAREYEGAITDYAAGLFEITGVQEVTEQGHSMKWRIALRNV